METSQLSLKGIDIETYRSIRRQTEALCAPLQKEDYVVQPIVDVSPPKWHLAHTSWFFETFILSRFLAGYKPYNDRYSYIFNSYYESVGERVLRDKRGHLTRPTTEEIYTYRAYIDEHMAELLEKLPENTGTLEQFFTIGLQHEQQHQELLVTDIKYILGNNPLFPAYAPKKTVADGNPGKVNFLEVEGGIYEIGYEGDGFAWDNEKPVHKVWLEDFAIGDRLVTNAEYMAFMEDKGYKDFRHWLSDGWDWVQKKNWQAPYYWHKLDGEWHNYTLHGLEKVNPDEAVTHISFFEADAYASWAGKRLLREEEWEAAAQRLGTGSHQNFVESACFHPIAAEAAAGQACRQLYGDTWEWTYSSYLPYPGYKRAEGALGEYNGKFMINQMVLRGGSCATPQSHFRPSYRNFFQPEKRWQFSGIRLAQ